MTATGAPSPVRVLVVDDHPLMREGMRALIASTPDLEVVAEAGDGEAARREAALCRPHVVVMDLRMPGTNGVEATRSIRAAVPGAQVLVLTMFEDDESVFAAMRAGASGYLVKGAVQEEILRAIRSVAAGHAVFGPSVARRIMDFFSDARQGPAAPESAAFPELTVREREILDLIAAGRSNPAIAEALFISRKTVSNHISSIFAKLRLVDRAEAIIRARDAGLGVRPAPDRGP